MNYNLAELICRKHEDAIFRIAIEEVRCSGSNTYTFGGLDYLSDKFATVLRDAGIMQGDVVAVVLPPSAAYVVAHFGALKLGAIVAPLSIELETGRLEHLIRESQSKAIIIDEALFNESEILSVDLQDRALFIASDYVSRNDFRDKGKGFWYEINSADADFKIAETDGTTLAYMFFEQGENKNLNKTVVVHSSILSSFHLFVQSHEESVVEGVHSQTCKDWSSKDFLLEKLIPTLYAGKHIRTNNDIEVEL